ncbi:hypothetical protein EV426DRAFT_700474 [Tirmania nivea]|nr:hypothetical protein EV426DRAFT_700474 [Tirmania nivea]
MALSYTRPYILKTLDSLMTLLWPRDCRYIILQTYLTLIIIINCFIVGTGTTTETPKIAKGPKEPASNSSTTINMTNSIPCPPLASKSAAEPPRLSLQKVPSVVEDDYITVEIGDSEEAFDFVEMKGYFKCNCFDCSECSEFDNSEWEVDFEECGGQEREAQECVAQESEAKECEAQQCEAPESEAEESEAEESEAEECEAQQCEAQRLEAQRWGAQWWGAQWWKAQGWKAQECEQGPERSLDSPKSDEE